MVLAYGLFALLGAGLSIILSGSSSPGVIAIGGFVGSLVCLCLSLIFEGKRSKNA